MAQRGASLGLKAAGAVLLSQAVFTQPLIEVRTNEELAEKKKLEDLDSIKVEGVNRISRHSLFMVRYRNCSCN